MVASRNTSNVCIHAALALNGLMAYYAMLIKDIPISIFASSVFLLYYSAILLRY